ncbi:hypothetical protein IID24_04760 [Patescibacteria group bacterium]|nr:hypothetical protein [Patescibacteria group bacterium]
MRAELKYGWRKGGEISVPVELTASQVFTAASGKFVFQTSNAMTLNIDGSTRIFGHLEVEDYTSASGAPLDIRNCIIDLTAIFRIPIDSGTYAIGMIGDTCDIAISSNVQGAQLDASAENTLMVVDGDVTDQNFVDVMMVPGVQGTGAGVED